MITSFYILTSYIMQIVKCNLSILTRELRDDAMQNWITISTLQDLTEIKRKTCDLLLRQTGERQRWGIPKYRKIWMPAKNRSTSKTETGCMMTDRTFWTYLRRNVVQRSWELLGRSPVAVMAKNERTSSKLLDILTFRPKTLQPPIPDFFKLGVVTLKRKYYYSFIIPMYLSLPDQEFVPPCMCSVKKSFPCVQSTVVSF